MLAPCVASAGCDGWSGLIPACTAGASPLWFLSPKLQRCSCQKQHVGSIFPGGRVSVMLTPARLEKGLKTRELPKKLFGGVLITDMSCHRVERQSPASPSLLFKSQEKVEKGCVGEEWLWDAWEHQGCSGLPWLQSQGWVMGTKTCTDPSCPPCLAAFPGGRLHFHRDFGV